MNSTFAFLAVLLAAAVPRPVASAAAGDDGLRRCIGGDGVTIFTDRRCQDLRAVDSPEPSAASTAGAPRAPLRSCARNQDELLSGVRTALETGDVNRLAGFYHWSGMGNAAGYRLMERLGRLSERPLVDVQLESSADPLGYGMYGASRTDPWEEFDADPSDPYAAGQDDPYSTGRRAPGPRAADRLRVDQMTDEDDAGARVTYFRLRSNAGCWWLQF